jgi:hypothetical protein
VYDPWSGFLLTGDTVLPGRLFAFDFPAWLDSLDPMVAFTGRRPVTHVMGCHIEMTGRPGQHRFDDFVIMNGPYRGYLGRLLARSIWARVWPAQTR